MMNQEICAKRRTGDTINTDRIIRRVDRLLLFKTHGHNAHRRQNIVAMTMMNQVIVLLLEFLDCLNFGLQCIVAMTDLEICATKRIGDIANTPTLIKTIRICYKKKLEPTDFAS